MSRKIERDLDENVANVLRTLCALAPDAELPASVVSKYWHLKRISDRASGSQLSPEQLAIVVLLADEGKAAPSDTEVKFVPQLFMEGDITPGDKLDVTWRKKNHTGTFVGVTGDGQVVVEIDGSERTVPATACRPQQELATV